MQSGPDKQAGRVSFRNRRLPLRELGLPPAGSVHLWYLDLGRLGNPMHGDPDASAPGLLTPRQQRTVRRFYLRLLLGAYLGVPGKQVKISRQIRGKPVLDPAHHPQAFDFSIAGSDGNCLIGISSAGNIGVDLELVNRRPGKPLALSRRYFSPDEIQVLGAVDAEQRNRAFMHTWACKEAVVKAAGHGIANRLNRFSVNALPWESPAILAMQDDDAACWQLAIVYPGDRHVGAVAVRQPSLSIEAFSLLPASG